MDKSDAQEALANVERHAGAGGENELPPGAPPLADEPATDEGETKPEGDDPQPEAVEAATDELDDDDEDDEVDDEDEDDEPAQRETAAPAARMGAGARTRAVDVPTARRAAAPPRGPLQRASGRKTPASARRGAERGKSRGRR